MKRVIERLKFSTLLRAFILSLIFFFLSHSDIKAQLCQSGFSCLNLDLASTDCSTMGGFPGTCSNDFGNGTCCAPWRTCLSGFSCLNVTQPECQNEGGSYVGCYTGHEAGTCCAPQSQCANPFTCSNQTRSDCTGSGGFYGACYTGSGPGTCCCCITLPSPTPIPECRGETTGNPGYCFWNNFDCIPPNDDEGNGGCPPTSIGWPQRCCVWPQLPGAPTLPPVTGSVQLTPRPALNPQCSGWARIYTAVGCIPVGTSTTFAVFVLRWAIGIAGGMAFLLITWSSFLIMSSSGNPQKIQAGRELLTSAIAGLMLLIFSVFILEAIGVRILRLPGF